jgi:mannosyltransferase OCH1-like enzyme
MIPKIIHQIWVGDFKLPKREQKLANEIKEMHSDYEYIFWSSPPPLSKNIQNWYDKFYSIKNYAFCADLLRIWAVKEFGGFYLDIDFKPVNSLDDFLNYDGVFLYHNEGDLTIPNNVFGAKKDLDVLEYCTQQINDSNNWYGPSWFGSVVKSSLGYSYETTHEVIKNKMREKNIEYFVYGEFENKYAKHLSLYSWSPEIWNRLNNQEQL